MLTKDIHSNDCKQISRNAYVMNFRNNIECISNGSTFTTLYCACQRGNVQGVKFILKNYEQTNLSDRQESTHGRTPLHGAQLSGSDRIATMLILCGVKPEMDIYGKLPKDIPPKSNSHIKKMEEFWKLYESEGIPGLEKQSFYKSLISQLPVNLLQKPENVKKIINPTKTPHNLKKPIITPNILNESDNTLNNSKDTENTPIGFNEPVINPNELKKTDNTPNGINEPVINPNELLEPDNTPNDLNGPVINPNELLEPDNTHNNSKEHVKVPTDFIEIDNTPNNLNEPVINPNELKETNNTPNGFNEPVINPNEIKEIGNTPNGLNEFVINPNELLEPVIVYNDLNFFDDTPNGFNEPVINPNKFLETNDATLNEFINIKILQQYLKENSRPRSPTCVMQRIKPELSKTPWWKLPEDKIMENTYENIVRYIVEKNEFIKLSRNNRMICSECHKTCWANKNKIPVKFHESIINNTSHTINIPDCQCSNLCSLIKLNCIHKEKPKNIQVLNFETIRKPIHFNSIFKINTNNTNTMVKVGPSGKISFKLQLDNSEQFTITHLLIHTTNNGFTDFMITTSKKFEHDDIIDMDRQKWKMLKKQNMIMGGIFLEDKNNIFPQMTYMGKIKNEIEWNEIELPTPLWGQTLLLNILNPNNLEIKFNFVFIGFLGIHKNLPFFNSIKSYFLPENKNMTCDVEFKRALSTKIDSIFTVKSIMDKIDNITNINNNILEKKDSDIQSRLNNYTLLNDDLKRYIFKFLDLSSKAICCSVCKSWQSIIKENYILDYIGIQISSMLFVCEKFSPIGKIIIEKIELFNKNNKLQTNIQKGRVTYLLETINDIISLLKKEEFVTLGSQPTSKYQMNFDIKSEYKMLKSYSKLVGILRVVIYDTYNLFVEILKGKMELNENFDIFELTIRRYYDQILKMFIEPAKSNSRILFFPEELISDINSRAMWIKHFGNNQYYVNSKLFSETFLEEFKCDDPGIRTVINDAIKFFVEFPKNGCITPYAIHLLGCHWGPHADIMTNIKKYAISYGFLGFMNQYAAEELVRESGDKTYLIRFSRLCPEQLTLTYLVRNIVHNERKAKDKTLEQMIHSNTSLKKCVVVKRKLHWLNINSHISLKDFYSAGPYISF